ncbi:hypothetical protein BDA96_10G030800 [Sorghum bicolor]|uniref:Uncharacterized protein n=2 Tax=Sorghum bicolor TaxID=4558 RepID=A0A921PZW4_SORBI|nr:hypothetical protein BDA96_10G030800 [Sorghum bicolor]OQU75767.1 hypothetical protein SORBI_3010G026775 [Sorghum bicolor]
MDKRSTATISSTGGVLGSPLWDCCLLARAYRCYHWRLFPVRVVLSGTFNV